MKIVTNLAKTNRKVGDFRTDLLFVKIYVIMIMYRIKFDATKREEVGLCAVARYSGRKDGKVYDVVGFGVKGDGDEKINSG